MEEQSSLSSPQAPAKSTSALLASPATEALPSSCHLTLASGTHFAPSLTRLFSCHLIIISFQIRLGLFFPVLGTERRFLWQALYC